MQLAGAGAGQSKPALGPGLGRGHVQVGGGVFTPLLLYPLAKCLWLRVDVPDEELADLARLHDLERNLLDALAGRPAHIPCIQRKGHSGACVCARISTTSARRRHVSAFGGPLAAAKYRGTQPGFVRGTTRAHALPHVGTAARTHIPPHACTHSPTWAPQHARTRQATETKPRMTALTHGLYCVVEHGETRCQDQ